MKTSAQKNVRRMIGAFNACVDSGKKDRNPRKISWSRGLLERFDAERKLPPEALAFASATLSTSGMTS